jgi:hypothetical protein
MLTEVLREFVAVYRLWHKRNPVISMLLLSVAGLVALRISWAVLLWIASFATSSGQRHAVAGQVTWQGKPLDVGIISFRSLEDQPFDSGAMIQRGYFEVPQEKGLLPGKYRVRIHASVADPSFPAPPPGERDTRPGIEILPKKYNATSELTAEVKKWGSTKLTFDLSP